MKIGNYRIDDFEFVTRINKGVDVARKRFGNFFIENCFKDADAGGADSDNSFAIFLRLNNIINCFLGNTDPFAVNLVIFDIISFHRIECSQADMQSNKFDSATHFFDLAN